MTKTQDQNGRDGVRAGLTSAKIVSMPSAKSKASGKRIESPCGRFFCDAHGLFRKATDNNKTDMKLSGPVWIIAETRGADGKGWGILLGWTDRDGQRHEQAFPRAMFAGDCAELRSQLADGGLTLQAGSHAKSAFADWLASIATEERAFSVNRIGWHTLNGGKVYVLPDGTYGNLKERVVLQTSEQDTNLFGVSGSAEDWKSNIGQFCKGNSRLVLAVSIAFAAPLLGVLGLDGGGVSFVGASRAGKSTALVVACSVCGGTPEGGAKGYARSWRSTGNGMESVASASCDALLAMDEVGQLDPKEIGDVAYMLANGQGKMRASRTGGARSTPLFRILFLSNGEKTLADLNRECGKSTKAGQEVRFVDMPADAGAGMGLFEETHHCDTPGEFADYLANACGQFYGASFRAFMEHLADRMAAEGMRKFREALLARMDTIATIYLQNWPKASGQVRSVARRFAMIALAGELATEFDLTGWDRDTPEVLVGLCFADWLRLRGTAGRREDEQAIQQLRDFISRNASARFEDWVDKSVEEQPQSGENGEPPKERYRTMNRAGWRRWVKAPDGRYVWLYLLTSDGMNEALNGLNARDAKKMLVERGLLIPAKDGKFSELLRPPGQGQVRLYQVHHDILAVATGDK